MLKTTSKNKTEKLEFLLNFTQQDIHFVDSKLGMIIGISGAQIGYALLMTDNKIWISLLIVSILTFTISAFGVFPRGNKRDYKTPFHFYDRSGGHITYADKDIKSSIIAISKITVIKFKIVRLSYIFIFIWFILLILGCIL